MDSHETKPIALLLPGLDGTGSLLGDFAAALSPWFEARIVQYPPDQPLAYEALLDLIRPQLPDAPFILIGESFSGPLALRLGQENPAGLKAVVLGASFARLDLPGKALLTRLAIIPPTLIPTWFIAFFLLGQWSTTVRRKRLRVALASVWPSAVRTRLKAALTVDLIEKEQEISFPLLYLRATADRFMPKSAARTLAKIAPALIVRDVSAPHFLFQITPEECARLIANFCREF